jgi:hydrogenase maturation protease
MQRHESRKPYLVAVVGNELAGDDAFGPTVGRALADRSIDGVEIVDLSIDPSRLLEHLWGRQMLILIDAVLAEEHTTGRLVVCLWTLAAANAIPGLRVSTHGVSLADQLRLAGQIGLLPPLAWMIGITVGEGSLGKGLSRESAALVASAADRAGELIAAHRKLEVAHA